MHSRRRQIAPRSVRLVEPASAVSTLLSVEPSSACSRVVIAMKRIFGLPLVLLILALVGCGHRSMIRYNRASNFYTLNQLHSDYTWITDVAEGWRTAIDMDAQEPPSYDDLAAYPLGNGEIFGINGLVVPLGALSNLIGPGYQKGAGFYGACLPAVSVGDRTEHLPAQMVEWVRQAGVVHTVQRGEKVALHVYDWVAPTGGTWYRLVIAENLAQSGLTNVSLIMAMNSPADATRQGRLVSSRAASCLTLGVVGRATAKSKGFTPDVPEGAEGAQSLASVEGLAHLTCPIGAIEKGQSAGKLFYLTFTGKETEAQAEQAAQQIEAKGLESLVEAYEQNSAWHKQGLVVETPNTRLNDLIEIQKHIIKVQQAATGGFSPMDKYTYTWIRDSVGPVRFFLQAGYYDEVKKYLEYQYMGNARAGEIRLNLGLDLGEPTEIEEPDWSQYPVERAEVPSYIVLQHYWYYQQTGDAELIDEHWNYLRRCIFGQQISERGTLPFHGDETYRFPGYSAFQQGMDVHDYVQLDCQSADSAFEFVAAAESMARMARDLERDDEVAEFEAIAGRIRTATEKYYWMPDRGYYAPAMSDFTDERHEYPFASINMRPLWIGYAEPDAQQRSNVVNSLKYLWKEGGGVRATPDFGYYTTMVAGYVLYNLVEIDHPLAPLWTLQQVHAVAEKSGGYAEMNTPQDRPAEDIWGKHRCRPWEGGINAHAVVHALIRPQVNAPANRISLSPWIEDEWRVMAVRNIPVGGSRLDLDVYGSVGQRVYELKVQQGEKPPAVDLNMRVPGRRITAVDGPFREYGGRIESRRYADGHTTVRIADIQMPLGEAVPIEIAYEQQEPPGTGLGTERFYYGAAQVKDTPDTLLLTWNPLTHAHYKEQLGGGLMAVDTKIPWPPEYLRGLLLPHVGRRGFDTALLDVETYSGAFRRPAFWTSGKGAQVLEEFKALGGKVEKAEKTTELPPSYRNLPREQ